MLISNFLFFIKTCICCKTNVFLTAMDQCHSVYDVSTNRPHASEINFLEMQNTAYFIENCFHNGVNRRLETHLHWFMGIVYYENSLFKEHCMERTIVLIQKRKRVGLIVWRCCSSFTQRIIISKYLRLKFILSITVSQNAENN